MKLEYFKQIAEAIGENAVLKRLRFSTHQVENRKLFSTAFSPIASAIGFFWYTPVCSINETSPVFPQPIPFFF
jgi:hypothetical protein